MQNDDKPVGRLLSRREVLGLLGASGAALVVGGALPRGRSRALLPPGFPSCVVRPEQTQGPYFVDEMLHRSDIRSDPGTGAVSEGAPLQLEFQVSQIKNGSCGPLAGAQVDVWHCDATGVYSDVTDPSFNTVGKKFLRGYQVTDAAGMARFNTVYPGWYRGRAVHIHFMIRSGPASGRRHEFVSQVYFDEALNDQVYGSAPYMKGQRTRNSADRIFQRGGSDLMLEVTEAAGRYSGVFRIGLDMG
jgi:protocatechuate 3,4-dioxygenase beta subunit